MNNKGLFPLKVKEYELSEVFHHGEDDHRYEVLKMEHLTQNSINVFNGNNDIETAIEEERQEQEVRQSRPKPRPRPMKQFIFSTPYSTTPYKTYYSTEDRMSNTM